MAKNTNLDGKKTFVLYIDQRTTFDNLPDDKAGKLIKMIFSYVNAEEPSSDDMLVQFAFEIIKEQLKEDLEKWREIRDKRKASGVLGGLASSKSKQMVANASKSNQMLANPSKSKQIQAVNVNVNDNVNVNNNNNINNKCVIYNKRTRTHEPTFEEVQEFANVNDIPSNVADNFYRHYSSQGWYAGNGLPITDWKQRLINWNIKDRCNNALINKTDNVKTNEYAEEFVKDLSKNRKEL